LRSVCLSACVSVCVCLPVYEHIDLWNRWTNLRELFADPLSPWLGTALDDVTFSRSGPYGDAWKAEPLTYYH